MFNPITLGFMKIVSHAVKQFCHAYSRLLYFDSHIFEVHNCLTNNDKVQLKTIYI
jgi:hypothetical protein